MSGEWEMTAFLNSFNLDSKPLALVRSIVSAFLALLLLALLSLTSLSDSLFVQDASPSNLPSLYAASPS